MANPNMPQGVYSCQGIFVSRNILTLFCTSGVQLSGICQKPVGVPDTTSCPRRNRTTDEPGSFAVRTTANPSPSEPAGGGLAQIIFWMACLGTRATTAKRRYYASQPSC